MALNIYEDRETHELARALAEREGTSITHAVGTALQEALRHRVRKPRPTLERLDEISRRCARLPVLDDRPADEILGYGERGLPE